MASQSSTPSPSLEDDGKKVITVKVTFTNHLAKTDDHASTSSLKLQFLAEKKDLLSSVELRKEIYSHILHPTSDTYPSSVSEKLFDFANDSSLTLSFKRKSKKHKDYIDLSSSSDFSSLKRSLLVKNHMKILATFSPKPTTSGFSSNPESSSEKKSKKHQKAAKQGDEDQLSGYASLLAEAFKNSLLHDDDKFSKDLKNSLLSVSNNILNSDLFSSLAALLETNLSKIYERIDELKLSNDEKVSSSNDNRGGDAGYHHSTKAIHRNVRCDGCDQMVRGIRYKCLECYDFDLCESCEASGFETNDDGCHHIKTHQLIKIQLAESPKLPRFYEPQQTPLCQKRPLRAFSQFWDVDVDQPGGPLPSCRSPHGDIPIYMRPRGAPPSAQSESASENEQLNLKLCQFESVLSLMDDLDAETYEEKVKLLCDLVEDYKCMKDINENLDVNSTEKSAVPADLLDLNEDEAEPIAIAKDVDFITTNVEEEHDDDSEIDITEEAEAYTDAEAIKEENAEVSEQDNFENEIVESASSSTATLETEEEESQKKRVDQSETQEEKTTENWITFTTDLLHSDRILKIEFLNESGEDLVQPEVSITFSNNDDVSSSSSINPIEELQLTPNVLESGSSKSLQVDLLSYVKDLNYTVKLDHLNSIKLSDANGLVYVSEGSDFITKRLTKVLPSSSSSSSSQLLTPLESTIETSSDSILKFPEISHEDFVVVDSTVEVIPTTIKLAEPEVETEAEAEAEAEAETSEVSEDSSETEDEYDILSTSDYEA